VDPERERFQSVQVLVVENRNQFAIALAEPDARRRIVWAGRLRRTASALGQRLLGGERSFADRGAPPDDGVGVGAAPALFAGIRHEREHALRVRTARKEIAEKVERVPAAEAHQVEKSLELVGAAVHVADDDDASHYLPVDEAPSLARLGITTIPR